MTAILHLAGALLFALGAALVLLTSVGVGEREHSALGALAAFLCGVMLFLTGVGLMGA